MKPRKFRTRPGPSGRWYEVEPVTYTLAGGMTVERLRAQAYPGRYHMGDFGSHEEIARKIHDLELTDLEPAFDDNE